MSSRKLGPDTRPPAERTQLRTPNMSLMKLVSVETRGIGAHNGTHNCDGEGEFLKHAHGFPYSSISTNVPWPDQPWPDQPDVCLERKRHRKICKHILLLLDFCSQSHAHAACPQPPSVRELTAPTDQFLHRLWSCCALSLAAHTGGAFGTASPFRRTRERSVTTRSIECVSVACFKNKLVQQQSMVTYGKALLGCATPLSLSRQYTGHLPHCDPLACTKQNTHSMIA